MRDKALAESYSSCHRLSELCALNTEDLDLKERTCIVTGKGNKTRIVPLGKATGLEGLDDA